MTDPANLTSGYYAIQAPGDGGGYLFRNRIEDYSLRPKFVGIQAPGGDSFELIIRVTPAGGD